MQPRSTSIFSHIYKYMYCSLPIGRFFIEDKARRNNVVSWGTRHEKTTRKNDFGLLSNLKYYDRTDYLFIVYEPNRIPPGP